MKFIKVIIVAVFLFSIMPIHHTNASNEIAKPVIESFGVDKKQVTAGEVVNISLGLNDNKNYRYLNLYYSSPITDKNITIQLDYDEQRDLFIGSYPITDYIESGTYMPDMISLYSSGITTIYSYEYEGFELGSFEVENTEGIEFIQSIAIDKSEVQIGDALNIQLKTSTHAGVRYMNSYFRSPVSNQTLTVSLYYNSETDSFEGRIPITSIMENGVYTLFQMNTYEIGGNNTTFYSRNYNGEFDNGNFAVSGSNVTNLVENILIDKNKVTVGESMNFTVKLAESVGINYLNLSYESPGIGYDFTVDLYFNNITGLYEGVFTPGIDFEEGEYPLTKIAVYDDSRNTTALYDDYNEFQNGDFTFYREANPPSFTGVTVEKTEIAPGEVVKINVLAEDDTKLSEAVVNFISPVTRIETPILMQYDEIQNLFYGEFYSVEESEVGTWEVDSIEIKDTNQNLTIVQKENTDLSAGGFVIKDVVQPEIPLVNEVTDQTTTVSGTAESGTLIKVKNQEKEIGFATADSEGRFSATIGKQVAGTTLNVTSTDSAGNVSGAREVLVLDITKPDAPSLDEVTDKSTTITGKAESEAHISVVAGNSEIGTTIADASGNFSFSIPKQKAGTELSVTAVDQAGNLSEATLVIVLDATAPNTPSVDAVTDKSFAVTGSGEVDALITIKVGTTKLGAASVKADGSYSIAIPKQKAGTKLSVTATDAAGNVSEVIVVNVSDVTAPNTPTVNEVNDKSTAVTGSGEANALITVKAGTTDIGSAKVEVDGTYSVTIPKQKAGTKLSVTAADDAGNISSAEEVSVLDVTAPNLPLVNKVTEQSVTVSGTAEVAAVISVKAGTSVIGIATVKTDGTYSVTIPKQKIGTVLTVAASDKAGNISPVKEVVVVDGTAPAVELTSKVTQHSIRVIGTAEAGAKIAIQAGTKSIGSAMADEKGNYEAVIASQKVGTKLSIVATDAAGNSSAPIIVTVEDGNYPDLKLTHWALGEIMYLADDQIIGGYPNGGFQPEKKTTRAEAAKMLALAMDLPVKDVSSGYKDVSNKHWAKNYIAAVSKAGLFGGNPDGTFAPDAVLKRAEMAKVISIAYELKASNNNHFKDVKSGYWAKGYISGLYENGITTGYPDETFRAEESTTRAEFSVFLARALNQDFR